MCRAAESTCYNQALREGGVPIEDGACATTCVLRSESCCLIMHDYKNMVVYSKGNHQQEEKPAH